MFKKFYLILFCMIFLFVVIPLVSSAPPFTSSPVVSSTSLQIESPNLPIIKIGEDKRFHAHVINQTRLKTNLTTQCALHVYNSTGWDISTGTQWMEFEGYNGIDFALTVKGGNFTNTGVYAYVIQCNSTNEVGFYRGQFTVTPSGEVGDSGTAIFYVGMLALLIFLLSVAVYFLIESDELLVKVGSFGASYILLTILTFVAWQTALQFLTSTLIVASILRIVFLVLMIGAFPLLIAGFVWYFLMLFKVKEIERLMTKGFSEDEARRRVK